MVWKFVDGPPVYLQIIAQIQGAVLIGEFAPGDRLPSVRTLAAEAQVNPNTMQHALQQLERDGLLITQGTSGRFVTRDLETIETTRQARILELVAQYAQHFAALGIAPDQAAQYLLQYEERNV